MSAIRDKLEDEIGARSVGSIELDGRSLPVAFATSEEHVVLLLKLANAQGWRVVPLGSGTKIGHGSVRDKARFAISLRGLSGVTAYERGDGTLSARAGSTMSALQNVARAGGNQLTPDVSLPAQATLGGTIAAGASGIDRLRYGPMRHHVLGMRVALADGTITKCGGRLVKNVTGYDLHRLYTGSRGELCVILEASLRLFPAPEREVVLRASYFGRDAALSAASLVLSTGAKPTCVCVDGSDGERWTLTVALAGRNEPVEWETTMVQRVLGECDTLESGLARAAIDALRDLEATVTLRANVLPAEVRSVLAAVDASLVATDATARVFVHPGIAYVDVALAADVVPTASVLTIARAVTATGADVELRHAPMDARLQHDPLERVSPAARVLMARLKSTFDPANRFAAVPARA